MSVDFKERGREAYRLGIPRDILDGTPDNMRDYLAHSPTHKEWVEGWDEAAAEDGWSGQLPQEASYG